MRARWFGSVLLVLLLAAVIGGVFLAKRERGGDN